MGLTYKIYIYISNEIKNRVTNLYISDRNQWIIPKSGIASETCGSVSVTILWNTVRDSRIVTPEIFKKGSRKCTKSGGPWCGFCYMKNTQINYWLFLLKWKWKLLFFLQEKYMVLHSLKDIHPEKGKSSNPCGYILFQTIF